MVMLNNTDSTSRPRIHQTGVFEKYILCDKCEHERLGQLERYAAMILNGGTSKTAPVFENRISNDGIRSIYASNLDYTKFKLFVLSIVWRAHTSSQRFFNAVTLSKEDAECIKSLLLRRLPGKEDEYRVSIVGLKNVNGELVRFLTSPWVGVIEGRPMATFYIAGFCYFINLSSLPAMELLEKVYLKETGEIEIPILNGMQSFELLKAMRINEPLAKYMTLMTVGNVIATKKKAEAPTYTLTYRNPPLSSSKPFR
ncbi:hypothetical protein GCM10023184_29460 [Flaviaesturariibacter amylovorans]|uniref:Matrix protein n=2 Tax=Flaviaesturariibacter amylovorans TaxID=1084520 RepID=A0ABP8H6X4_9BACT